MNTSLTMAVCLILVLSGCATSSLQSSQGKMKPFMISPPPASDMNVELAVRGSASKSLLFMKVFTAVLYMPLGIESSDVLLPQTPRCLSVSFYANFSSHDFSNFTLERMKANLTAEEMSSLIEQINRMKELLPDIKNGDTLSLFYETDKGTSFIHNGQNRGTIQGGLFAKGIFSTWFGAKPFDERLKRQLLGGKS